MNDNEKLLDKAIDLYLTGLKGLDSFISEPSAEYSLSFEQYLILKKIVHNPKIKLMDIDDELVVTRRDSFGPSWIIITSNKKLILKIVGGCS